MSSLQTNQVSQFLLYEGLPRDDPFLSHDGLPRDDPLNSQPTLKNMPYDTFGYYSEVYLS
jgi:hypothetical protein